MNKSLVLTALVASAAVAQAYTPIFLPSTGAGTTNASGALETNWQLIAAPYAPGNTPSPNAAGYSARTSWNIFGVWAAPAGAASWISPFSNDLLPQYDSSTPLFPLTNGEYVGSGSEQYSQSNFRTSPFTFPNLGAQEYVWQLTFNLTAAEVAALDAAPGDIYLGLRWTADNTATLRFNGTTIGTRGNLDYGTTQSLFISSLTPGIVFNVGTNTLEITASNTSADGSAGDINPGWNTNPTGILVDSLVIIPEASSIGLIAGAAALAFAASRRRTS